MEIKEENKMKRKTQLLVVITIVLALFVATSATSVVGHANNPSETPMMPPTGDEGQSCKDNVYNPHTNQDSIDST